MSYEVWKMTRNRFRLAAFGIESPPKPGYAVHLGFYTHLSATRESERGAGGRLVAAAAAGTVGVMVGGAQNGELRGAVGP